MFKSEKANEFYKNLENKLKGRNFVKEFDNDEKGKLFALYIIASRANFDFKNFIIENGDEKVHFYSSMKEKVFEDELFKQELRKEKYDVLKEFKARMEEFKTQNPDFYSIRKQVPNIAGYLKEFEFNTEGLTVDEAIQGYKLSNEILNELKEHEEIRISEVRILKPEHKEDLDKFITETEEDLGYSDRMFKEEVAAHNYKDTVISFRLALNRKKAEDVTPLDKFTKQFLTVQGID